MPSDIHRNYGNNVADIYRQMGQAKANARLQQGQGWANAIANIGQTIASIPGQMAEQKQQEIRSELTDLQMQEVRGNLERAKQRDAQTMAIADLVSAATINGQFDKDAFSTAAAAKGMGQIVPEVVKTFADAERSLLELDNAKRQSTITDAQLGKLQQDFLRPFALQLWENKFDPSVVNGTFAALRAMDVPEELVKSWEAMPPEQMSLMVQQLLPRAQAPEPFTLSEGEVRMMPQTDAYGRPVTGVDGQPVMSRVEGNQKAETLDQQLAAALKAGDREAVNRIIKTKAQEANATRAPQQDDRIVQVMGPDGTPIWVSERDAIGKPAAQAARAVTGAERQALAYYNRAKDAAENIAPLEPKIAEMGLTGQVGMQVLPNFLQSNDGQLYRQAQRAFTEARLRKESGAAIPTHEYDNDAKTYFAQPGDSAETQAQKRKAREAVLNGLAYASGKAFDEFYGQSFRDAGKGPNPSGSGGLVPASTPPPDQSGGWKWDGKAWVKR